LVLTSLIAVTCASFVGNLIPHQYIRYGAGFLFVILGLLMLITK
jgi:putative Ca2+/H+ antiporter (TMEM165/GDT1 family)